MLDYYVKDVVSSFVLFWIGIGPMIYRIYLKNEDKVREEIVQDKYADLLVQIKDTQAEKKAME